MGEVKLTPDSKHRGCIENFQHIVGILCKQCSGFSTRDQVSEEKASISISAFHVGQCFKGAQVKRSSKFNQRRMLAPEQRVDRVLNTNFAEPA
jgi:hypothetical protein